MFIVAEANLGHFCKVHGTLKTTPAVAAGLTDHVWTIRELLEKTGSTH